MKCSDSFLSGLMRKFKPSLASQPLPPLLHSYERAGEGSGFTPIQIPFQRGGA